MSRIMVSSGARGSPSSLHEEVVEKYPSFDTLRDSTAIESTNSLDLNKVLNIPNERGNGGGEKKKGEKKTVDFGGVRGGRFERRETNAEERDQRRSRRW